MTVLVTGGLGSIGAHTALALADLGEQVVVTRHRRASPPLLGTAMSVRFFAERNCEFRLWKTTAMMTRPMMTGIEPRSPACIFRLNSET